MELEYRWLALKTGVLDELDLPDVVAARLRALRGADAVRERMPVHALVG